MKRTKSIKMQEKNENYINNFLLRGWVEKKEISLFSLSLTLRIKGRDGNKYDHPTVISYNVKMNKAIETEISVGDRIEVYGHLQSAKRLKEPRLILDSYSPVKYKSRIDASFAGQPRALDDENSVMLKATVYNHPYAPNDKATILNVKTKINNYQYFLNIVCFDNNAKKASGAKIGDSIEALCHIKTRSIDESAKRHSIIVQSINIIQTMSVT